MIASSYSRERRRAAVMLGVSSVGVLLLTALHHIYGARVYHTEWRSHVAFGALPSGAFIALSLFASTRYAERTLGRVALWSAIIATAIVPVAGIGLFEGLYNHLLKNVLYFGGANRELLMKLFPPPSYEMPNNWFFEVTGVLQFFACLPAVYYGYVLLRKRAAADRAANRAWSAPRRAAHW